MFINNGSYFSFCETTGGYSTIVIYIPLHLIYGKDTSSIALPKYVILTRDHPEGSEKYINPIKYYELKHRIIDQLYNLEPQVNFHLARKSC